MFNGILDGILFVHNYYHGSGEDAASQERDLLAGGHRMWSTPGRGDCAERDQCRIKLGVARCVERTTVNCVR